jgi:hypothetical protein
MHELAAFYSVASESFEEEPRRRISFFKRENSAVPLITLSQFIRRLTGRQRQPPPSPSPSISIGTPSVPRHMSTTTTVGVIPRNRNRGWEQPIPSPPAPADAWSDEDS